jgi:hypothetical protein
MKKYFVFGICFSTQLLMAVIPLTASADTCRQGYVWREASQNDHVCVTPETRDQTLADNRTQPREKCPRGLVWREATPQDHVCVDLGTRAQAWDDNAHAQERFQKKAKKHKKYISAAEVAVVNVGGPAELNSASGATLWADIQYSTHYESTMQIWVEEYPAGSGCSGDIHQTNGGRLDIRVAAGERSQRFYFPWNGHRTKAGFLQIGARLNGIEAMSGVCLRFSLRR